VKQGRDNYYINQSLLDILTDNRLWCVWDPNPSCSIGSSWLRGHPPGVQNSTTLILTAKAQRREVHEGLLTLKSYTYSSCFFGQSLLSSYLFEFHAIMIKHSLIEIDSRRVLQQSTQQKTFSWWLDSWLATITYKK
jgi:hypothetical protein